MGQIENPLKSKLVKASQKYGDYARRLEDQYAVGLPDILYGVKDGTTCLIEAKNVPDNMFGPTPRQHEELRRFDNGDRRSLILGFKDGLFYLHGYAEQVHIRDCEVSDPDEPFHFFIRRFLK